MLERFDRSDLRFLLLCGLIFAVGLGIGLRWFGDAFPEASIQFDVDRSGSARVAEDFLREQAIDVEDATHAASFSWNDQAKIFLERSLGLRQASDLMRDRVNVWFWRNRWFRPLQIDEVTVNVAPSGRLVGFRHRVAEDAPAARLAKGKDIEIAMEFLTKRGVRAGDLDLVSRSEIERPKRVDTILTWESRSFRPADAPYKYSVTFHGDQIGEFREWLDVPEQWQRDYAELRSRNDTTGMVDSVFLLATILLATGVFVSRLRRGDVHVRFAVGAALAGGILVTLVQLNQFPNVLARYNTDSSFAAFIALRLSAAIVQGIATGLFLAIVVGAGDVLYRERFPGSLAIPRLFSLEGFRSKRVFKGFVLGYTLFAAFLAYQVVFYLTASRHGAWSPADIPYDDILNTAFPWLSVLFIGFFPAMSEEYLSRAFSIPFFEKLMRSRVAAIVVAGLIWGFGHAAYPNQPFYIRGVEVGIAGIVIGMLLIRFGLLPLLVWHYTVDALYTSLLLFSSGNLYYVVTGALATFVFLVPAIVSIVLYRRHGGFVADSSLDNETLPVRPPEERARDESVEPLPESIRPTRRLPVVLAIALAILAIVFVTSGPSLRDIIDYRMTKQDAARLARADLERRTIEVPERAIVIPSEGFRSWDASAKREDGGTPGDYASVATRYILREADDPVATILDTQRHRVQAATWVVRFFTPGVKEEIFVELDPRHPPDAGAMVGFHRYLAEKDPGATLTREAAEAAAIRELAHNGLDADQFEVREALSFKQPERLDWLFHFDEKAPIAGEVRRRVSIRVAGDAVSQFAKTIRIPETIEREENEQTAFDAVLFLAKIAGIVALFGFVVAGVVVHTRRHPFRWRRAARIAAWLSLMPLIATALQMDSILAQYQTSMKWSTFQIGVGVSVFTIAAFQLLMTWLALSSIESIHPWVGRILSTDSRSRFGRHAAIAAVTALAIGGIAAAIPDLTVRFLPRYAVVTDLSIPPLIAASLPAVAGLWGSAFRSLLACAAVAAIASLAAEVAPARRWQLLAGVFASIVLVGLDPSVGAAQIPVMLLRALLPAAAIFFVALVVLRRNVLAWGVTILCSIAIADGIDLIRNHRSDLRANGAIVIVVVLILLVALGMSRSTTLPAETTPPSQS